MSFGSWLTKTMKECNLKTSDLAKATKSHHNVVRAWERGLNLPSAKKYAFIIKVLAKEGHHNYLNLCKESQKALLNEP